ncbi:S9 family peptidase [Antrihabitans sp. YC2-6]|uniref:S9 family peptidase n=1 Tax=Antrihabitans sp. YC2-6 TaxID=2799498 RepID=UPI0018F5DCD8|nr:prolyl oligopeptidase family serine peptidase [Antrihabitans sp. YC2-6]MBJ8347893.1 S9 family peptidase [Antrihabitans sp. YC2-6]
MTSGLDQDSFPRQYARTVRYTVGAPRSFAVAGTKVVFLRSRSGSDRANMLWTLDTVSGKERIAADPAVLLHGGAEELSAAEQARRERSRETSAGIVGFALDDAGRQAVFALSGRLFVTDLDKRATSELRVPGPLVDPRLSPDGAYVAYATVDGELRVIGTDGSGDAALGRPEHPGVVWGQAEFIAQEEMGRSRGYWWSPDSDRLLAERSDDTPVRRWWIADPANPERRPAEVAYPAAGTPNADVDLWLFDLAGSRTEITWDKAEFPYLAHVHWSIGGPPLLLVQARDQRSQRVLTVDIDSGATDVVLEESDDTWLDLFPGVPAWTPGGDVVRISDATGVRCLVVGDRALTGPELHVRSVVATTESTVYFTASGGVEETGPRPGWVGVARIGLDGSGFEWVSTTDGVSTAVVGDGITVVSTARVDRPGTQVRVLESGATIASHAEQPILVARPQFRFAGARRIPSAVFLPSDYDGSALLPVLMDPYGGPHGQRVAAAHNPHLTSQWFADQGFAVVVADGRGTPGRSPEWEKSIAFDFAGATLDDQVEALHALAEEFPLDLGRVGIRGWSYGGYLAALAVLRRPDVFHVGVAGAPVTDWSLYDTHYTERYLGMPDSKVYPANSLIDYAPELERPLLLIHGLADDNVVVAHTLRLSSALLAAGRPYSVLPLSGVTHMASQEDIAENLLKLQVDFIKKGLG